MQCIFSGESEFACLADPSMLNVHRYPWMIPMLSIYLRFSHSSLNLADHHPDSTDNGKLEIELYILAVLSALPVPVLQL